MTAGLKTAPVGFFCPNIAGRGADQGSLTQNADDHLIRWQIRRIASGLTLERE